MTFDDCDIINNVPDWIQGKLSNINNRKSSSKEKSEQDSLDMEKVVKAYKIEEKQVTIREETFEGS